MVVCLMYVIALSLFLKDASSALVLVEVGLWGVWFPQVNGPSGYLACGMGLRNDPYNSSGSNDNTGVNAIKFIWCKVDDCSLQQSSLLNEGFYGNWLPDVMCPSGSFIYGIRAKFQDYVGPSSDDSGLTGFEIKCRDSFSNASSTIQVLDSIKGTWKVWAESTSQYVCGGKIRFEEILKGPGDATGLNGLYVDFCDYVCFSTVANCNRCTVYNNCIDCNVGYFLYSNSGSNSCVNPCPSGYRGDSSLNPPSCIACVIMNCAVCPTSSSCTSCKTSYYLDNSSSNTLCVTTCHSGYRADSATQSCIACSITNCHDCSSDVNICISCKLTYYLYYSSSNTLCVNPCPSGYRGDSAIIPNKCVGCSVLNCDICPTDTTCSVCKANYFLHTSNITYTCENPCPSRFRGDVSVSPNACIACSVSNCDICTNTNDCVICLVGYYLLIVGDITTCELPCPRGYRGDTVSYPPSCIPCEVPDCDICDSSGRCTECKNTHYLHTEGITTTCEKACPSGYRGDSATQSCMACSITNCHDCTLGLNSCISCITDYFLYISTQATLCVSTCPLGYRGDSEGKCNLCSPGYVNVLDSPYTCVLKIDNCIEYIKTDTDWKCLKCDEGYFAFEVSINKIVCAEVINRCSDYILEDLHLICNSCELGFHLSESKDECLILNCLAHRKDADKEYCSQCSIGYQIDSVGKCNRCSENYERASEDPFTCIPKIINCLYYLQSELGYICKECKMGYKLGSSGLCDECESSYALVSGTCYPKINLCSRYISENETIYCSDCHKDAMFDCGSSCNMAKKCICKYGFYMSSGQVCEVCPNHCKSCDIESENLKCLDCEAGYNLVNFDCIISKTSRISASTEIALGKVETTAWGIVIASCSVSILSLNTRRLLSIIGMIQILTYILLHNINIPSRTRIILRGISFLNIQPNIFEYFISSDESLDIERYNRIDIKDELFLINAGKIVTTLIIIIVIILFLKALHRFSARLQDFNLIKKVIERLNDHVWNFCIGYLIQGSLELTIFSLINIYHVSLYNTHSIIELIISVIIIVRYTLDSFTYIPYHNIHIPNSKL